MDILRSFYDILPREYSSNVVIRVDVTLNENKKEQFHRTIVMAPIGKKAEGDPRAEQVKDLFNQLNK